MILHAFNRREFVRIATAAGAGLLLAPRSSRAADARIDVLTTERIGPITADLYGHFVEHLGGVVYDGVWVGERSRVPNTAGIRQALVDHMRRLPPGAIRWPGGCFADSYDWRDGIGPVAQRPRRTNFWNDERAMVKRPEGPGKHDPNTFGSNEFMRFCRLAGGAPYFAANVRSLPARDFYQWIEYCNAPAGASSLADQRAAGGSREPFGVRFWGVGNESWGCGGEFTPEEYATEYRRFVAWVPRYGVNLAFIGSGPNGGDLAWTRRFFTKLLEKGEGQLRRLWGWGLHHYSWNTSRGATTDWYQGKGDAVKFSVDEWYELLNEADRMDGLISGHWAVMGELDRRHQVKLVVDEWGAWYREGTEVHPTHLFGQQSTMRDALLAALTLDTFHRHADKVAMSNVAQLINCLHSLFLATEDRFLATPTFDVFEMYGAHVGGQAVRATFSAPRITYQRVNGAGSFWGLAGSASVKDKTLTLTVVNPHVSEKRPVEIAIRGASPAAAKALVLAAPDIHAHNTFDQPRNVRPRDQPVDPPRDGLLAVDLQPASVTRFTMALA
jgi:alpha-N-arabinofuranosidase